MVLLSFGWTPNLSRSVEQTPFNAVGHGRAMSVTFDTQTDTFGTSAQRVHVTFR
jgi:hypothetical protein